MLDEEIVGQRFSQVYLRQAELLQDSQRLRNRLGSLYASYDDRVGFRYYVQSELGIHLGEVIYDYQWTKAMKNLELKDVLDTITLRYRMLAKSGLSQAPVKSRHFILCARRIFQEEQVRYRIDDAGGVHFAVDEEFERVRTSAISSLGAARYRSAMSSFEAAFKALDSAPPDGKMAIRNVFFSLENLFRLMFPTAHQLSASEIQKHLRPKIDKFYADAKPALQVAHKQLLGFQDWIDGAHFYRHEPGTEDPSQPPTELALQIVSHGGAYLRWLATLDGQIEFTEPT